MAIIEPITGNRTWGDRIIIAVVTNGLSIALALSIAMLLTRR